MRRTPPGWPAWRGTTATTGPAPPPPRTRRPAPSSRRGELAARGQLADHMVLDGTDRGDLARRHLVDGFEIELVLQRERQLQQRQRMEPEVVDQVGLGTGRLVPVRSQLDHHRPHRGPYLGLRALSPTGR